MMGTSKGIFCSDQECWHHPAQNSAGWHYYDFAAYQYEDACCDGKKCQDNAQTENEPYHMADGWQQENLYFH
jgi:hypothetical protein